ncbi:hypothetical protein AmDm5_3147 [Acetobacter malorum]|nr:hypothetical protein AmDm5_3147 [Acetobacter malorum]
MTASHYADINDHQVRVRHCSESGSVSTTNLASVLDQLRHNKCSHEQITTIRNHYLAHGHASLPWSAERPAEWIENTDRSEGWAGTLTDGEMA